MADNKVTLTLHVQPRAKRNEVLGFTDGILRLKITAPPVDGKANKEVINYLSDILDIPKSSISIDHGQAGKNKMISIIGPNREQIYKLIEAARKK